MSNQGWIRIHRKILDNPIISKPDYLSVWVVLLLLANHQEHSFIWNNEKQTCKRGQILTGRKELSRKTGVNENKIERILKYLKSEQQIEQQTTTKFRLITIKNYQAYQDSEQQNEQQVNNKRTTDEQQVNTNKNDNNYKNEKNENIISKDIQVAPESTTIEIKESFGNEEINKMLNTIKDLLHLTDFKETKAMQRNFGKHLVGLKNKIGKDEFGSRFMQLAHDEFHMKNMGSLKYIYNQIKGFVPIVKDKSIPEIGIDPTKT
jgi:hypothetical protein